MCDHMVNIADADASNWTQNILKSNKLTIVYFWHDRCSWCIKLNPIFNALSEEYEGKIKFAKFNILKSQENQELAANNGVMGTPTLVFFCQGRAIGQVVSFAPKEELTRVLEDMLQKYELCLKQSTDLKNYVI